MALASPDKEEIIYAKIDLDVARKKRDTIQPGQHVTDFIKDRRPEQYGIISESMDEITRT